MNETSVIRPWQPAQAPRSSVRPQTSLPTEADERLMMARLFGKGAPQAVKAQPVPRGADDDFAPNLGRHVDVVA